MSKKTATGKAETATDEMNCTLCKFFLSFRNEYADLLEPRDYGTCHNKYSELQGNEGAGIDAACTCFTLNQEEVF